MPAFLSPFYLSSPTDHIIVERSELRSSSASIDISGSSESVQSATKITYNIDRYVDQDIFDDGTIHGRVPDHASPDGCVNFYEARARNIIAAFDAAHAQTAGAGPSG
jgi:hypothetical protein